MLHGTIFPLLLGAAVENNFSAALWKNMFYIFKAH